MIDRIGSLRIILFMSRNGRIEKETKSKKEDKKGKGRRWADDVVTRAAQFRVKNFGDDHDDRLHSAYDTRGSSFLKIHRDSFSLRSISICGVSIIIVFA